MGSGWLLPGAPPPTGVLPGPETDGAGRGEHRLRWGPGRTGRECPQPRRGREPRLEEAASPPGVTTDPAHLCPIQPQFWGTLSPKGQAGGSRREVRTRGDRKALSCGLCARGASMLEQKQMNELLGAPGSCLDEEPPGAPRGKKSQTQVSEARPPPPPRRPSSKWS